MYTFSFNEDLLFFLDLQHLYLLLKSIPSAAEALIQEIQKHISSIGLEVVNSLRGDNVSKVH